MGYERTLASVAALRSRVSTDPVAVYQEANKALQLFTGQLRGEAQFLQLKTESLALITKTQRPFAANRLRQAKQLASKKRFIEAKVAMENALKLDPGLSEAKQLLRNVREQASKQESKKAVESFLAQAKTDMSVAKKYATAKDYIAADTLLSGIIDRLDAIPERHLKHVDVSLTRRAIQQQKKGISGRVKRQRAMKERERRKAERERREADELAARCGKQPLRSTWDGEVPAARVHVERTAHDADSIEVKNCTVPQLTNKFCWITTCDVRGKNVFGAMVLNRVRFSIGKHPSVEGYGQVIAATSL